MDSRVRFAALVIAAALIAPSSARAQQPTAAEKETARSLMNEGRARRDRHDLKGAVESFQAADAIMHVPTTGFELARSQAALGLLVEARDTLRRVLRSPAAANEPRPFVEARANAQALDRELAERIPSIHIALHGAPAGAQPSVEVDRVSIPAEAASAPLKVNPGHHAVVVTAGNATGRAEVDVEERASKTVDVQLVAAPAEARADAAAGVASAPPPEDEPAPRAHTMRTIAWTGFGVAIAGAAVGSVTGLMSLSTTGKVKDSCVDNVCPASSQSDLDSARAMATVSTVAFGAAGIGLAVGVTALLIADRGGEEKGEHAPAAEGHAARVMPWIGVGSAGVRGTF